MSDSMTLQYVRDLNDLARRKTGRDWVVVEKGRAPLSYRTTNDTHISALGSVSATRRAVSYLVGVLGDIGCDFAETAVVNRAVRAMPRMWVHPSMSDMVALGVEDVRSHRSV